MRKLFIASDHAGRPLKEHLKSLAEEMGLKWVDLGTDSDKSVDYPDYAEKLSKEVLANPESRGILVCGSGQGMAIKANRHLGIRAALAWDTTSARLSREHNNTNVLCMGARLIPFGLATEILKVWLNTEFAGGRHQGRVDKLDC